jgi:hypothetical protein
MLEAFVGAVIGAIFSIIITIFVEVQRKPKLILSIGEPTQLPLFDSSTFLRLKVQNCELPKPLKFLQRNTAEQCHGIVVFRHLDGQKVFVNQMEMRWTGTPEIVPSKLYIGVKSYPIFDLSKYSTSSRIDICTGDSGEEIDVVGRFGDDIECYGVNNESYLHNWKTPKWKLDKGIYLVDVTIISVGEKIKGLYRLINDGNKADFRLEPARPEDHAKIID